MQIICIIKKQFVILSKNLTHKNYTAMTRIETNFQKAFKMANVNGQEFLNNWLFDRKITNIIPTDENWFYITVEFNDGSTHAYAISQKSNCKSSRFGSVEYLKKQLKEQNIYI